MFSSSFIKISIGIDISKDTFNVCLMGLLADNKTNIRGTHKFSNNATGFEKFWQWIQKKLSKLEGPVEYLMESTGTYYENLAWFLHDQGQQVVVVLPNRAHYFFRSEGLKSKNDKIDAQGLAKMSLFRHHQPWRPLSASLKNLRTQTRYYASLQKDLTRNKNRLHALEHSHHPEPMVVKQLKLQIKNLQKQADKFKDSIIKMVKQDPKLATRTEYLCSIPGIGWLTAAIVVAETNGFALFTSLKQLTSYAGYDIIEHQSGKFRGKTRISKQGNAFIRRALHFPSLTAVKPKGSFYQLQSRIFDQTLLKMKGYVAVQRKLLCLMYTLWKKEEMFDPTLNVKKVEEPQAPLHEIVK